MECFLIENIKKYAEQNPDKPAFIEYTTNRSINYSTFWEKIHSFGTALKKANLTNKLCLLFLPFGIDSIITIFSCFFAGVIPIIRTINTTSQNGKLEHQFHETLSILKDISVVISTEKISDLEKLCKANNLPYFDYQNFNDSITLTDTPKFIDADLIYTTSGSTSVAKGIKLTFTHLQKRFDIEINNMNLNYNSTTVTYAPYSHILGFCLGLCMPLYTGSTSILLSPSDIGSKPTLILEAITKYKATHTAMNTSVLNSCTTSLKKNLSLNLNSLKTLLLGGESVKHTILMDFENTFKHYGFNSSAFAPSYGMTENSGAICTLTPEDKYLYLSVDPIAFANNQIIESIKDTSIKIISNGTPDTATKVLICDEKFNILPESTIGEIVYNSPSLTDGYLTYNDNENFIFINNERFFRTGDLGFIKAGQLFITGRLKELIIAKGKKYSPVNIENIAKNTDTNYILGENSAFVYDENGEDMVILFQELTQEIDNSQKTKLKNEILSSVKLKINLELNDIIFLSKNEIPRTQNGKIQRLACKKLYAEKYGHINNVQRGSKDKESLQ